MASTRNKNNTGEYILEQNSYNKRMEYTTYVNGASGQAHLNHLAGNGLLMGKRANTELSHNPCDIEGFLFGIGSTNLVNPTAPPTAQLKQLDSLDISNKLPVIIPTPMAIEPNQRPQLW